MISETTLTTAVERGVVTADQVATLDAASDVTPAYPVWHQRGFPMLNERAGR